MLEEEEYEEYELHMSNVDYDMEYLMRHKRTRAGSKRYIHFDRSRMNEKTFEKSATPTRNKPLSKRLFRSLIPPEPVKSALTPPLTRDAWINFFLVRFPIVSWIWSYQPSYIGGDIIAGITMAIMQVPQGLAYALLATVPAVYGLYTSVVPVLVYSLLGTSRHVSVGTFAVVELMIGNAIQRTLPLLNLTVCSSTDINDIPVDLDGTDTTCGEVKVEIAFTLSLMTGLVMLLFGIFRLGFITIFLSDSLISGYTTAASMHVFSSQLKHITGIPIPRSSQIYSLPLTWISFFQKIEMIQAAPVIISILCIVALVIFKIANLMLQKYVKVPFPSFKGRRKGCAKVKVAWPFRIPSQLIVVVVVTLIFSLISFDGKDDVSVVGNITAGIPPLSLPNPVMYGQYLIKDAFIIAIVTYCITISLVKVFARRYDYAFDSNQEFVAYGLMNIVGSFFSSFPAAGSLSRAAVLATSGGNTQLVGIISAGIILVVLAALSPLFYFLPLCVLAAIIWVSLYGMFTQIADVWRLFKVSIWDLTVWLVVFLATVFIGVELGLAVGVAYSLLCLVIRTILPYSSILGKAEGMEMFRNIENFDKVVPVPGVAIFRFQGPICFLNSAVFRSRLEILCGLHGKTGGSSKDGCLQQLYQSMQMAHKRSNDNPVLPRNVTTKQNGFSNIAAIDSVTALTSPIERSGSFQAAMESDIVDRASDSEGSSNSTANDESESNESNVRIHSVIVDCAPISFIDVMGVKALQQVVLDFDKQDVQVLFAAMTRENRDILKSSGFYKKCGKQSLFPTLQGAIYQAMSGNPLRPKEVDVSKLVLPVITDQTPSQTPSHVHNEEVDNHTNVNIPTTPVLATDTVSDEFSGLKLSDDVPEKPVSSQVNEHSTL